jgi:hypothetical protein
MRPPKLWLAHSGVRRTVAPLLRCVILRAAVLALVSGLAGVRPAAAGAAVDLNFPDLGRLQVLLVPAAGGPGWANSAWPRTALAYALAAEGVDASTVFPVAAARGTLSRNLASEELALYSPHRSVSCFAYFAGRANGAWRISHPHSAGHRRFDEPPPDPRTPGDR